MTIWRTTMSVRPLFPTSIVSLDVPLPSTVPLTPDPGVADAAVGTMATVAPHSSTDSVLRMTTLPDSVRGDTTHPSSRISTLDSDRREATIGWAVGRSKCETPRDLRAPWYLTLSR